MCNRVVALAVLAIVLGSDIPDARAVVTQPAPDMTPLPQLVSVAEQNIVTSRGLTPNVLFLEALFLMRGEAIGISADATATPGTFYPRCPAAGIDVDFLLGGGICNMALAWYNISPNGTPPAPGELHTVVPLTARQLLNCSMPDFCPLAGTPALFTSWTPMTFTADVCGNAAYAGGAIGFALIGNSASLCPVTKYSEARANVVCTVCTPNQPWITALIYQSTVNADGSYLAFEDLPMSPTNWKVSNSLGTLGPDGDFNDFVFHIRGACHGRPCPGGTGTGGQGSGTGGQSGTVGNSGGRSGGSGGQAGSAVNTGGRPASGGSDGSGGQLGTGGDGGGATGGNDTGAGTGGNDVGGSGTGGSMGAACVPGRSVVCPCPNGLNGFQTCSASGERYESCQCKAGIAPKSGGGCGCTVHPADHDGRAFAMVAFVVFAGLVVGRRSRR